MIIYCTVRELFIPTVQFYSFEVTPCHLIQETLLTGLALTKKVRKEAWDFLSRRFLSDPYRSHQFSSETGTEL